LIVITIPWDIPKFWTYLISSSLVSKIVLTGTGPGVIEDTASFKGNSVNPEKNRFSDGGKKEKERSSEGFN